MDHHVSNTKFAENNFVFSDASATGEILAKFFRFRFEIDAVTADALYLGICTDTGQFCYSGTNAAVFEICRKLCKLSGNPSGVPKSCMKERNQGEYSFCRNFASFRMEFDDRVCVEASMRSFKETAHSRKMLRISLITLDLWKALNGALIKIVGEY